MQALVVAGADVNAKKNNGRTALMIASYFGHPKVVKVLLDKGARVDEKDSSGYLALDFAKSGNHKEIVEMLTQVQATK